MNESNWARTGETTKQAPTKYGHALRHFWPDGLTLGIRCGDKELFATLSPADALALARDIEREYGGKE